MLCVCKAWDNAQGTFIVVEIKVHDYTSYKH